MTHSDTDTAWLSAFCERQCLPSSYIDLASTYLVPIANELLNLNDKKSPLFIGINGCQGSGKSTLAALFSEYLTDHHSKRVANLSIDDFYLTYKERQQLAANIHPLLATRGVPGTHDTQLLQDCISKLRANSGTQTIPRFDKANDDRATENSWDTIETPVDIIILEGWCIGVTEQTASALEEPANRLERDEDSEGIWRTWVNQQIATHYTPIFNQLDQLIMLKAPSFECVFEWRQLQEEKLIASLPKNSDTRVMNKAELERFIHHYQRLTEHMLNELPYKADIVLALNHAHEITQRTNNS